MDKLLKISKVAEVLKVSRSFVYKMERSGQLKSLRWSIPKGGKRKKEIIRFLPSEITRFIEERATEYCQERKVWTNICSDFAKANGKD